MDFETFKEEVRGDIEKALYERTGTEHSVEIHTVEKMNETYEAITIKPENSSIGVNINANELFKKTISIRLPLYFIYDIITVLIQKMCLGNLVQLRQT